MSTSRLLARSSWQFYRRHPAQLLLSVLGIVLGVAIVTAVLITNHSSQRAFALSSEALYGRTTHQLTGARGIEQSAYVALRQQLPDIRMAPVIQGHVAIAKDVFSILGLDPFSEAAFARAGAAPERGSQASSDSTVEATNLARQLLRPDALLISTANLNSQQFRVGQQLDINVGGQQNRATLAGSFESASPAASTGMLIGDIAFVQTLLQRDSRIDRIDLILDDADVLRVSEALPATLRMDVAASRQQTMQAMTRGFHINLTAMSLLALVVGVFLIHNTMTFAVVQRRELFAVKRIIGISSRTLFFTIVAEAVVISFAGSVLGIALGYLVAHELIKLTTQTINDLYFVLHIQQIWFSPWLIAAGLFLGIGSSVLAASLSAIDAASTSPVQARQRSVIEQRTHDILPRFAIAGFLLALVGLVSANLPLQSLIVGFAAMMLLILGYGMTLPWLVRKIASWLKPLSSRLGISVSLAVGGIERNISRTGLAVAALCIAVSATFGVDIMIGSFRSTVDQWLGTTLQSDIYVSVPSAATAQGATLLTPGFDERARRIPGIRSVSTGRSIQAATDIGSLDMLVVQPHPGSDTGFELIDGDKDTAWQQWSTGDALMISEPLATKYQRSAGDSLRVFTENDGYQDFTITAVFRDYGSSHGKLLMSRSVFDRFWRDTQVGTLGIMLDDPATGVDTIMQLRESLATIDTPLIIQLNTTIHEQSLAVFDRTFEVTRVLRWLTVGVAFVGIFSALLALHLERAREFAIIRATGATRLQIMNIVLLQTLIMGLLAGILALPLGWLMSEILIKVINVRSFGWSMHSIVPAGSTSGTLLLAATSAILAGIYPAWKLSRSAIASQLRDD